MLVMVEKIIGLGTKLAMLIGGGVLFTYCLGIRHFPESMTIVDGVYLIFLASSFGIISILYISSLSMLGFTFITLTHLIYSQCIILIVKITPNKISSFILKYRFKKKRRSTNWVGYDFPKVELHFHLISIVALIFILLLGVKSWEYLISVLISSSLGGVLIFLMIGFNRNRKIASILINNDIELARALKNNRSALILLPITFIFVIFINGGVFPILAEKSMIATGIRKENVTVYVKKPYSIIMEHHDIIGDLSLVSDDYKRFSSVNILLSSFGSNKIVQVRNGGDKLFVFAIPSDHIIVDGIELK